MSFLLKKCLRKCRKDPSETDQPTVQDVNDLSAEQKRDIGKRACEGETFSQYSDRTVRGYKQKYRQSVPVGRRGRPPRLDVETSKQVEMEARAKPMTFEEQDAILECGFEKTANKRGKTVQVSGVSSTTKKLYRKKLHFNKRNKAQKTNPRRAEAQMNFRNAVSFAIMLVAIMSLVPGGRPSPHLTGHLDATTVKLGQGRTRDSVAFYVADSIDTNETPITIEGEQPRIFRAKAYYLQMASGALAPPVFVLASDDVQKGDIVKIPVPGLSPTGSEGHVWIMQSRHPTRQVSCPF